MTRRYHEKAFEAAKAKKEAEKETQALASAMQYYTKAAERGDAEAKGRLTALEEATRSKA